MRIIALFNSKDANPKNVQLIFTTHGTNLLSANIFRQDQIWFAQKDRYGGAELYSLAKYKVCNNASFEKDYLAGKYGTITVLDDLPGCSPQKNNSMVAARSKMVFGFELG